VWRKSPQILYYLPASANKTPVIRDIIYLASVRWLFPKTIFHYHAGGLPEYLEEAGMLGAVAKKCYAQADLSVEICRTECSPGEMFEAKKTVYIPNGLDVELVLKKKPNEGQLRVLFLGALNEGKGVLHVVKTAKILKEKGADIKFSLVGAWASETFQAEVLTTVESLGLNEMVDFSGVKKVLKNGKLMLEQIVFSFPQIINLKTSPWC